MKDNIYYEEIGNESRVFESCFQNQLPLLIKGPTGCGKSQFVAHMAKKLDREIIQVSCNEDTSSTDLLGRFLIKNSDTVWVDGPVTRAVRNGAILYLDEVVEAREDVIVVLHSLTDHRRELFLDRTGESIKGQNSFMCVASFNPHYQKGLKQLKPSIRQRFVTIEFNYPPEDKELKILKSITGAEDKLCKKMVELANGIRKQSDLGLSETVSTRILVHAIKLMQAGIYTREAGEYAIAQCLSDDPSTVTALKDFISLKL